MPRPAHDITTHKQSSWDNKRGHHRGHFVFKAACTFVLKMMRPKSAVYTPSFGFKAACIFVLEMMRSKSAIYTLCFGF